MVQLTALSDELLSKIFGFVPGRDVLVTVPLVCRRFRKICKHSLGAELDLRWLAEWPDASKVHRTVMASKACDAHGYAMIRSCWQHELFYGSCCTANLRLGLEKLNVLFDRFARIKTIRLGTYGV